MSYFTYCNALLKIAFYTVLMLGASSRLAAQEDVYVDVARFSILIETSGDEIILTCDEGCEWKQLSFTSSIKSDPQAIDQNGLTTSPLNLSKKESLPSSFLFTIRRTQDGVSLEGKEGTIWPSLTLDCTGGKCFRKIDGWGVAEIKRN